MSSWVAALAVGLAALGIGVSLVGAQANSPWLEHRLGPGLTVAGAFVWVAGRWGSRRD